MSEDEEELSEDGDRRSAKAGTVGMLRALIVANHFPPIGGGGVQRAAKFARYLPEFGIEPVVLSGPGRTEGPWTPPDPTLLADVEGVEIVRLTGSSPPGDTGGLRERLARMASVRDDFVRWWIDGIERVGPSAGLGVDVILGELVPYETGFGVEKLAQRLGVPWVADLQDPWALDEMRLYLSAAHRLMDRRRMRQTLATAAAVVMNTEEARARLLSAFPEFRGRRVVSIPNGFDSSDFDFEVPPRDDSVFRIVHTGYLHTESGERHQRSSRLRRALGGMPVGGVVFLTRSHVYLMRAIEQVLEREPGLRGKIELHLVGRETAGDRRAAEGRSFVSFHGYLAHQATVAMMRTADLLFLPMQELPGSVRAGLVPGKTYEYIASGTPVLAAVPDGDARDLLLEVGNATVCRPAAVDCLANAILQHVEAWSKGTPRVEPEPKVLARYERKALTAQLAAVLQDVAGRPVTALVEPPGGRGA